MYRLSFLLLISTSFLAGCIDDGNYRRGGNNNYGNNSGSYDNSPRYERIVRCESQNPAVRTNCPMNIRNGRVEVYRQLSRKSCDLGSSWDYSGSGIWVTNGCRAEFGINPYYGANTNNRYANDPYYNDPYSDYGKRAPYSRYQRTIRCESQGHLQQYCQVDTRDGVTLIDQLSKSDCRYNDTWGYDNGGIWVRGGCRAKFGVGN